MRSLSADVCDEQVEDVASETLGRFFAACLAPPGSPSKELLSQRENLALAGQAADLLREEYAGRPTDLGPGEFPASDLHLEELVEHLENAGSFRDEYHRVFGLASARECPPYETEYQPQDDTFFRSQQLADIAGFYQAFGLRSADTIRERPDHITLELEFLSWLLTKKRLVREAAESPEQVQERIAICEQARTAFVRDHIIWWIPLFTTSLRHHGAGTYLEYVGRCLAAWVAIERTRLGLPAPRFPLAVGGSTSDDCASCEAACSS